MAVTFPLNKAKLPSDIQALGGNGQISLTKLTVVGPSGWLHPTVARGYFALAFCCLGIGLPLTYTYGGTYRTYLQQETTFRIRYTTTKTAYRFLADGTPVYQTKSWMGMTWYQRPGTASAAVPGTSNHGWASALDFAFDSDPSNGIGPNDADNIVAHPAFAQFVELAHKCGFFHELASEPWHLHWYYGDEIPQFVLDVERFIDEQNNPSTPPVIVPTPVPERDGIMLHLVHQSDAEVGTNAYTGYTLDGNALGWQNNGVVPDLENLTGDVTVVNLRKFAEDMTQKHGVSFHADHILHAVIKSKSTVSPMPPNVWQNGGLRKSWVASAANDHAKLTNEEADAL